MSSENDNGGASHPTIVGGRPPGAGVGSGAVPRSIEVLLKKAACDPAFRAELLEQRSGAAERLRLPLTPDEAALLEVAPAEQLDAIIASTTVPRELKSVLLGDDGPAMIARLEVLELMAMPVTGIRPDIAPQGIRPDLASRGIRPGIPGGGGSTAGCAVRWLVLLAFVAVVVLLVWRAIA